MRVSHLTAFLTHIRYFIIFAARNASTMNGRLCLELTVRLVGTKHFRLLFFACFRFIPSAHLAAARLITRNACTFLIQKGISLRELYKLLPDDVSLWKSKEREDAVKRTHEQNEGKDGNATNASHSFVPRIKKDDCVHLFRRGENFPRSRPFHKSSLFCREARSTH